MAFPNDLSNVAAFKIHPAIGIARLANNDDYYEFFAQLALPKEQRKYMSNVNGVPTMRRQAVQFKIFAYNSELNELGELTDDIMQRLNLTSKWSADIANRKLLNYGQKKGTPLPAVEAIGSATRNETTELKGNNPWHAGETITLGFITGQGLFIPGHGDVARKTPQSNISGYPADQGQSLDCCDTTADGSISVDLTGTKIPVIPACVVCAPQEHAPNVSAADILKAFEIKPGSNTGRNADWTTALKSKLSITGNPPVTTGTKMDAEMIATTNGEFNPGMETSFATSRTEFTEAQIPGLFFKRGVNHIWPAEIRPQYKISGRGDGALPGQLTSGLCSTWQGDLAACLNYWTAEFPAYVYVGNDPNPKDLFREHCDSGSRLSGPELINKVADNMGVAINTSNDPDEINFVETERNC